MYLTVDDFQAKAGMLHLPLTGTWTAVVSLDPSTSPKPVPSPGMRVSVVVGDALALTGTVRRSNNAFETILARIVGGGGGLNQVLPAKTYYQVTLNQVVTDILGQVGEQLSGTTDQNLLGQSLPFWSTMEGQASFQLGQLVDQAGANWRVLPDGTVWLGTESWPSTDMSEWDLFSWRPDEGMSVVYANSPTLVPGQAWSGGKVANVQHLIEGAKIRTSVWFQDQAVSA